MKYVYPGFPDFHRQMEDLVHYAKLKYERGGTGIGDCISEVIREIRRLTAGIANLPEDPELKAKEPDDLAGILELRPEGPRVMKGSLTPGEYRDKLLGGIYGRFAGTTLGAPVEGWPVERMRAWAGECGSDFPPTDYWPSMHTPNDLRYGVSRFDDYTRPRLREVPADDDILYTLVGLFIVEDHGFDFTTADVAAAWLKYLPFACTAEAVALDNLKAGVEPGRAAEVDNPYCEWIGADIRADGFGYLAPLNPEKAASMGYHDAYVSHRRNGIYGEMLFSAAVSAAFGVDHPIEAIGIGLTEIPKDCSLAVAIRWALDTAPGIKDYRDARSAVDERFGDMHIGHTINNACLTVFGLAIGGTDVTRVISETVAMGLDNDCTAATAGSIAGVVAGAGRIHERWYAPFNDTILTYMHGYPRFRISEITDRFAALARLS